jgi:serine/threonine-protein kinase
MSTMAHGEEVRVLGRYALEEQIATGTTATIWRAHDTRTGQEVAVKRFHSYLLTDRVARHRMESEAKAAKRVHGRTIVSAIGMISTKDEFALVFPFVPGIPLAERLRQEPPLTVAQSAAIAANVAEALTVIHRAGLIHRDVKPGNILLAEHGRAQLLDFGISRAVTDEIQAAQSITGAGLAIGTLPYMAPEQLAAQPASPATDIFALGVVLYEMLAGVRPFTSSTPLALADEQRKPPARIDGVPEPLVDVALRALAVDPPVRPLAAQMTTELRTWLAHPLAAEVPTATFPGAPLVSAADRASGGRGIALGLAGAASMLLIAIVALAAVQPMAGPEAAATRAPLAAAVAPTTTESPQPGTSVAPSPVPASESPTKAPATAEAPSPRPVRNAPKAPTPDHKRHHAPHHKHHHHHRRPRP